MLWVRLVFTLFCLVDIALVYQLVWGQKGAMEYVHLRATHSRLLAETEALDAKNMVLSGDIRRLKKNSAYLERVVRDELNFVGDKEIVYLFDPFPAQPQHHDIDSE